MTTVLRVKRRNDDERTNDAFVIAGKRRKLEAGASSCSSDDAGGTTSLTTVLKFAGTLKNQKDDIVAHLRKTLTKQELTDNYKQHVVDNFAAKARLQAEKQSRANRYKVVNYNRTVHAGKTDDEEENIVTVIDVEDSISSLANKTPDPNDEIGYVYDVYYTQTEEDMHLDDDVSIHPFEQELVFDTYRENGAPDLSCESEDSNSESNWRNDYPDSDHSSKSIDDDDMKAAVQKLKVDGETSDLSSDENEFVYSIDDGDVECFGHKYANYKARMKKEFEDDDDSDKSDSSDPDFEPSDDNKETEED